MNANGKLGRYAEAAYVGKDATIAAKVYDVLLADAHYNRVLSTIRMTSEKIGEDAGYYIIISAGSKKNLYDACEFVRGGWHTLRAAARVH